MVLWWRDARRLGSHDDAITASSSSSDCVLLLRPLPWREQGLGSGPLVESRDMALRRLPTRRVSVATPAEVTVGGTDDGPPVWEPGGGVGWAFMKPLQLLLPRLSHRGLWLGRTRL